MILNGVITFSQNGASIFYWILAALSLGFVLIGLLMTIRRLLGTVSLEITETTIRIPHGFIKREFIEVNLSDLLKLSETEVSGQCFLYLHTADRKYCLNCALMPSKEAYEEAKALIASIMADMQTP